MGAGLSCLPHSFFNHDDDDYRRASAGTSASRWRQCCRHFFFGPSCCGMYEALFQTSEEQAANTGPLLQSARHADGTSALDSVPTSRSAYANTRNVERHNHLLRHDKMRTNLRQAHIGETQYRNGSGSGQHTEALVIGHVKLSDVNRDQKHGGAVSKLPPSCKNNKDEEVTALLDDEEICPTCLDGYDRENPKIVTKCGHHFHLACIFEWMERSNRCPLCDQEMIFNESL